MSETQVIVDQRLAAFEARLYASMRQGNAALADSIDNLRGAVAATCDMDFTDNADSVSLPVHVADMLDSLRSSRPGVFEALHAASLEYIEAPPTRRVQVARSLMDRISSMKG